MTQLLILKLMIIAIFCSSSFGMTLLQCLAKEETYYAKIKYTGPNYKLNQVMIEEITSLGNLSLNDSYNKKICYNSAFPSLRLLEFLLKKEERLIKLEAENALQHITYKALLDKSGNIFISYLTGLQSTFTVPGCVENKVPEIKTLMERYLYLQEDVSKSVLDGNDQFIDSLFLKLNNPKTFKDCTK